MRILRRCYRFLVMLFGACCLGYRLYLFIGTLGAQNLTKKLLWILQCFS